MLLYGNRQSRAARCLWLLEELGMPFEQVPVDLSAGGNRTDSYLALNPAGKIPALVDGDFVLTESIAINHYLAAREPTPLWPVDPKSRARIEQWSSWAVSEMEVPLTLIVREKRAATAGGREADGAVIAALLGAATTTLGTLEARLDGGSSYLADEAFTLAEINTATAVMVAPVFLDMAAFPATAAWLGRCFARPTWGRVQRRP